MMKLLVILVILGMFFSPVFAAAEDWNINLLKVTPGGDPIILWNCNWEGEGPYNIHVEMDLTSPYEESLPAEIYAYNPNKGEWFHIHTCYNVDNEGKYCKFDVPLYWGLSENNEDANIDLIKAELKNGNNTHTKIFNFHVSHKRTSDEEFVIKKIAEFNSMMKNLECKEVGLPVANRVAETQQLAYACQLSDAKMEITGAINELNSRMNEKGICDTGETEGKKETVVPPKESPEEKIPESKENKTSQTPITPPTTSSQTKKDAGLCGPALILLVGVIGFVWRK